MPHMMLIILRSLGKAVGYSLLVILLLASVFIGYQYYDTWRARQAGYVIPQSFSTSQITQLNGHMRLVDPYPELDWVEGYTVGPYESLNTPLLKWTGKPCKIYRDFCEGTNVDSVFSVVLVNKDKDVVAAFTVPVNLICAGRQEHFMREDPILCITKGL